MNNVCTQLYISIKFEHSQSNHQWGFDLQNHGQSSSFLKTKKVGNTVINYYVNTAPTMDYFLLLKNVSTGRIIAYQ